MSFDKDIMRRERSELIHALKIAGAKFKGEKVCTCPFHADKHASAGVYEERGVWRFKCHGCNFGGDVIDVMARIEGKKPEDVLRELAAKEQPRQRQQRTERKSVDKPVFPTIEALKGAIPGTQAAYVYTNPVTKGPEMIVMRAVRGDGSKQFIQARPVEGGFIMEAPEKPLPIYNRTRLAVADAVLVVEGEKCVHALAEIGIVATTSPGGANNGHLADWSPLAGKTVYLWHDADPINPPEHPRPGIRNGVEHMKVVAAKLLELNPPARVFWIDALQLELPPKGDVVEFLELFGGSNAEEKRAAVRCVMEMAQPMGGAEDLAALIDETISGKRRAISWPWPVVTQFSRALMPGTITAICGDPGSTKSFYLLEAAWYWFKSGVKVAVFELEEDRAYHLGRTLAQLEENSDLTDPEWIFRNPQDAKDAFARQREFLDNFARCIHAAPDHQVSLDDLISWVRRMAIAGCRLIAIDPITAATASERPWIDDLRFLMAVKTIARQYGCSIVLVTHPRKGRKTSMGLDDLAGGAAYPRFSQTVLWIHRHDKPRKVLIAGACGNFDSTINRSVRMSKTRNGPGAGLELGYYFDGRSLRFSEQGAVIKAKNDGLKEQIEEQAT